MSLDYQSRNSNNQSLAHIEEQGIQTQDDRRLKSFYKFFKLHKFVAPDTLSFVNNASPSSPFRFTVQIVENINYKMKINQSNSGASPYIKLYMTFFSRTRNKFFGRTYRSAIYKLSLNQNGFLEILSHIEVFYLTKLDKSSNTVLVIEVQLLGNKIN